MIVWLDHLIYGSGHGLATPFWDGRFYWLVDQKTKRGELYTWSGWFGSQLQSFQWTHPNAGERRTLAGHDFKPFHSTRTWFRVRVAWALTRTPESVDECNKFLRELEPKLGKN